MLTLGTQSPTPNFASALAASIIETRQQRAERMQKDQEPVTKGDLKEFFKELRAEWKEDIKSSVTAEFASWRPGIDSQIADLQAAFDLLKKQRARDKGKRRGGVGNRSHRSVGAEEQFVFGRIPGASSSSGRWPRRCITSTDGGRRGACQPAGPSGQRYGRSPTSVTVCSPCSITCCSPYYVSDGRFR